VTSKLNGVQLDQMEDFKRVSYFRMEPEGKANRLTLDQLDGSLCTHLILASVRINCHGELKVARESDYKYLNSVRLIKMKYPHLKVMISIANDEDMNGFSRLTLAQQQHNYYHHYHESSNSTGSEKEVNQREQMTNLAPNELRLKFAKAAMEFMQHFHLDGLDLNWQFPNFPSLTILNLREHERLGFTKILTSLRSAIVENFYARQLAAQQLGLAQHHQLGMQRVASYSSTNLNRTEQQQESLGVASRQCSPLATDVEPYLLSITIGGQESILRSSNELKQLINLCDWFNVMSYDYFLFKTYAPFTGPIAPLQPIVEPFVPIFNKLSFSWTVSRLVNEEMLPKDKIVMGIPTYARAYRLVFRQNQPSPFSLALGLLKSNQLETSPNRTNRQDKEEEQDFLDYGKVLRLIERADSVVEYDERAKVPYLLTDAGCTWVSFEDERSVRAKVEYILRNELAGYMTWNLNSDSYPTPTTVQAQDQDKERSSTDKKTNSKTEVWFPLHRAMLEAFREFCSSRNSC